MTGQMLATLKAELKEKPYLLLEEMAELLWVKFLDVVQPSLNLSIPILVKHLISTNIGVAYRLFSFYF